jgi:hypothetical protein
MVVFVESQNYFSRNMVYVVPGKSRTNHGPARSTARGSDYKKFLPLLLLNFFGYHYRGNCSKVKGTTWGENHRRMDELTSTLSCGLGEFQKAIHKRSISNE